MLPAALRSVHPDTGLDPHSLGPRSSLCLRLPCRYLVPSNARTVQLFSRSHGRVITWLTVVMIMATIVMVVMVVVAVVVVVVVAAGSRACG